MEVGEDCHEVTVVHLSEDDQGLAAGQFAAFYQGRTCIGSGIILESWVDQGFPVCAKALQAARLEDKLKLDKAVKIKVKLESSLKEIKHNDGNDLNIKLRRIHKSSIEVLQFHKSEELEMLMGIAEDSMLKLSLSDKYCRPEPRLS